MPTRFRSRSLLFLSLATTLLACDPKATAGAAQGAIGVEPAKAIDARPGPDGGVTPTLPPTVDPVRDPSPEVDPNLGTPTPLPGGIDGGKGTVPWKLQNPAAGSGCKCKLVCGPANDDRSKDCITMCEGTGC